MHETMVRAVQVDVIVKVAVFKRGLYPTLYAFGLVPVPELKKKIPFCWLNGKGFKGL